MKKFVEIGTVFKPHGLKGEVKLRLYNAEESNLKKHQKVLLKPLSEVSRIDEKGELWKIATLKNAKFTIVKFDQIDSIDEIGPMLPFSLWLNETDLAPLKAGEYFIKDLIGLSVIDNKNGETIGEVIDFRDGPGGLNLIIEAAENLELPFRDVFFPHVDLVKKIITCNLPEYI